MITRFYEPVCNDGHKSFYGKAHIVIDDHQNTWLKSYDTYVCMIECGNPKIIKLWDGYSRTTARHIDAFCETLHMKKLNKKEWEKLPVNKNILLPE